MSSYVARTSVFGPLKIALVRDRTQIVALRGPGGFGKTTLAHLLEQDSEILAAFDGGVYWVVLGTDQTEATLLAKVNSLIGSITGTVPSTQDIHMASRALAQALAARRALLVLDDAWQSRDVRPFIPSKFPGSVLITAREADAIPQGARVLAVDKMSEQESLELLSLGIVGAEKTSFETLLEIVSGWPVLLSLLNGRLREDIADGISLRQSIDEIVRLYKASGLRGFDINSVSYRDQELTSILFYSMGRLRSDMQQTFRELSIFPDDVAIPVSILSKFWGVSLETGLEFARKFYRCSLVKDFDRSTAGHEYIRLHDVIRDALRGHPQVNISALNNEFLQKFRPGGESPRWALLAPQEEYLWVFLAWHLAEARRWPEYKETFADLEFVAKHSLYAGRRRTEAALRAVSQHEAIANLLMFFEQAGHLLDPLSSVPDRQATIASHTQSIQFPAGPHLRIGWAERQFSRTTRMGHQGSVLCCDSNDAKHLVVTGGSDNVLRVWDSDAGQELKALIGHSSWVRTCAIDASGENCISGSDDGSIRLWHILSGKCVQSFRGHAGPVRGCDFDQSGAWLVSSSFDTTIRIWDPSNGNCRRVLEGHSGPVWCCKVLPGGKRILSGSADRTLRIWNAESGSVERVFVGHEGGVRSCDVSADGTLAVSASDDRRLIIWDLASGTCLRILEGHDRPVRGCAMSADGRTVVSAGGDDSTIKIWDVATGNLVKTLVGHGSWVMACGLLNGDSRAMSTSVDGTTRIWHLASGAQELIFEGEPTILWACSVGDALCAVGSVDGTLRLLDFDTGRPRSSSQAHSGCIRHLELDEGRDTVISVSDDTTIRCLGLQKLDGHEVGRHASGVRTCALSKDGRLLLTAGDDGVLKAWRLLERAGELPGTSYTFLFDVGDTNSVVQDCTILYGESDLQAATVSSDGIVRIWDINARTEISRFVWGRAALTCCSAHPQEADVFAFGAEDAAVVICNRRNGVMSELKGHTDWVSAVVFSHDGRLLASTSDDLTVRVWDVEARAPLAALSLKESIFDCRWHKSTGGLLVVGAGGVAKIMTALN